MTKPSDLIAAALADELEHRGRRRRDVKDRSAFRGSAGGLGRGTSPLPADSGRMTPPPTVLRNPPVGETVTVSGTAVTIAGAGSGLFAAGETVDVQSGFDSVTGAGDVPTIRLSALVHVDAKVRWTDGWRGGASVTVKVAGVVVPSTWDDTPPWSGWSGQCVVPVAKDDSVEVVVTPADGGAHTADVEATVSVVEGLRVQLETLEGAPEGVLITGADYNADGLGATRLWLLPYGSSTPETVPLPSALGSTEKLYAGCVTASGAVLVGDESGQVWRASSVPSASADWTLVHTATGGDPVYGMATDGTKVRALSDDHAGAASTMLVSDDEGETWSEVATTAGAANHAHHVVWGGGRWVRWQSGDASRFETSTDGDTWSDGTITAGEATTSLNGCAVDGDTILFGFTRNVGATITHDGLLSTDGGSTWSGFDVGFGDGTGDGGTAAVVTGAGTLLLFDGDGSSVQRNAGGGWSAATWTPPAGAFQMSSVTEQQAVEPGSGRIVVHHVYDFVALSDDDGASWSNIEFASDESIDLYGVFCSVVAPSGGG